MPVDVGGGLFADTVGDLLRQNPRLPGEDEPDAPIPHVVPPRLDRQPEFPAPGIYFGMPESTYHSIFACSASVIKDMAVSPMYAWAKSPLNPDREDDDTDAKTLGRAYHVRICEGAEEYARRYAVALDKRDFPDVLVTVDEISAAIIEAGHTPLGRIETGQMKPAPTIKEPDRVKPVTRAPTKADWIAQLIEISPDAQIWDAMVARHAEENAGLEMISAKADHSIAVAARMIESDPALSKAFSGGYAEVSLFWHDAATGAPCKARVDYLKMQAFVDLKSFSLKIERPVDRAIDFEIASRKHYIPVVHYSDGIAAVKALAREGDLNAIFWYDVKTLDCNALVAWVKKWANVTDDPTPLYVFQATGIAPITRGRIMHNGTVAAVTRMAVDGLRRKFVECVNTFNVDPWVDISPIRATVDEEIPLSATDFGA